MSRVEGLIKTRPAGAGLEFFARTEERQAAEPAGIDAFLVIIEERTAERPLGTMGKEDMALLRRQLRRQPARVRGVMS